MYILKCEDYVNSARYEIIENSRPPSAANARPSGVGRGQFARSDIRGSLRSQLLAILYFVMDI